MFILFIIAILDGIIVAKRSISRRYRPASGLSVLMGIVYSLIALVTLVSPLSLLLGSIVLLGPVALCLLRFILFGSQTH